MQLNIKVKKKWQLPIYTSTPLFQGYPPFLTKFLVTPPPPTPTPPGDSIFWSPYPLFNKGGEGGSNYGITEIPQME